MKKEKKWYQKVSNWLMIVVCTILVAILALNIAIMVQAKTNSDKVPSVFGYKPFIVLSGSMESKIKKGDLIITKITDADKLQVGDIIAFRDSQDQVTTHRIIEIVEKDGETYFVTKGDNNDSQDQNLVELSDVEGIYVGRVPGIGSMLNTLAEPTTIVIIVFGITAAFGIGFAVSSKKEKALEMKEFEEFKKMKEAESKEAKVEKTKAKKAESKKVTPKKSNPEESTTKKTSTKKSSSKSTSKNK